MSDRWGTGISFEVPCLGDEFRKSTLPLGVWFGREHAQPQVGFSYIVCSDMNMKRQEDPEDEEIQIAGVTYSGGDGSVPGEAIVVGGTGSHAEGIRAEKRYIARYFGEEGSDWCLKSQSLFVEDSRAVDELTIENKSGETETLYFEVSDLFGSDD